MSDPTRGSGGDESSEFRGLLDQLEEHAGSAAAAPRESASAEAGEVPAAVTEICRFWPTLRTVLEIALRLPFISQRVKNVIRSAIPVFDRLCPSS